MLILTGFRNEKLVPEEKIGMDCWEISPEGRMLLCASSLILAEVVWVR